jgi:hypothetical protein
MGYVNPITGGTPAPDPNAPYATGGRRQPVTGPKRKTPVDPRHAAAVKRRDAKLHANAMVRYNAAKAPSLSASDRALLDAATRLKFGETETGLNQQIQANQGYQQNIPGWYAQALQEIKGLQGQGQKNSQGALERIQSYNSKATVPGNATDQQSADARNNLNAEFAAMFGRDSQANSAFMDRLAAAQAIAQGNALAGAGQDKQKLLAAKTALGGQKADYKLGYLAQQQAAQQKAAADQAKLDLAAQALGLKVETYKNVQVPLAKSLAGDRTAGQKVARGKVRSKNKQDAVKNAQWANEQALKAYKIAHPNSGKGAGSNSTYSKAKVQGFRQNWDYAQATAHQLKDTKTYKDKAGKVKPVTEGVAYSALLNATKDPDIAKAASLAAFGQPIPPELRHRLAIKGVHLSKPKKQGGATGVVNTGINILKALGSK